MASEERVDELLKQARALPVDKQRRIAAILGSVVADAAAQPLHWIYDPVTLKRAVADVEYPEFMPQSSNPFYDLPTGEQSPYGDQHINMLESLVASKGFNWDDSAERYFKAFGPGSPYDCPVVHKFELALKEKPALRPRWQKVVMKRFGVLYPEKKRPEELPEEDKNKDPDNVPRSVPIVALHAGKPELLSTVNESCSQLQSYDLALALNLAACRIIEQYILQDNVESEGSPQVDKVIEELKSPQRTFPRESDSLVVGYLTDALATKDMSVIDATAKMGKA